MEIICEKIGAPEGNNLREKIPGGKQSAGEDVIYKRKLVRKRREQVRTCSLFCDSGEQIGRSESSEPIVQGRRRRAGEVKGKMPETIKDWMRKTMERQPGPDQAAAE